MKTVTLIPGDGIGPEVIDSAVRVIQASGAKIDFERVDAGETVMKKEGTPLPEYVFEAIRKNKVALKGPITTPIASGFRSVNVALRKRLNLYANVRPCKSLEGFKYRYSGIDITVIRENTEGLYIGKERYLDNKHTKAEAIRLITREASERIFRFAFEYALKEKRRKITVVHKANILKYTDGIFLDAAKDVADDYPKIEFEDRIVDNMCMQLVKNPEMYDVLVCPNLFGDIISDLCAGLIGGLGMAPGANIGKKYAVFEPIHGSAPKYAGKNKVNPTATILSGVLMLKYMGMKKEADIITSAIEEAIREGKKLTYDLGGSAGTSEYTEYVISKII